MSKRFYFFALVCGALFAGVTSAQHPMIDWLVQKRQNSTCAQPKSQMERQAGAANAQRSADMRRLYPGLWQAFERARYSLEDSGHGTYRGANPSQRLTFEFNGRGKPG